MTYNSKFENNINPRGIVIVKTFWKLLKTKELSVLHFAASHCFFDSHWKFFLLKNVETIVKFSARNVLQIDFNSKYTVENDSDEKYLNIPLKIN